MTEFGPQHNPCGHMAAGSIGRKHEESLVLEQEKKLSGPCDERGEQVGFRLAYTTGILPHIWRNNLAY